VRTITIFVAGELATMFETIPIVAVLVQVCMEEGFGYIPALDAASDVLQHRRNLRLRACTATNTLARHWCDFRLDVGSAICSDSHCVRSGLPYRSYGLVLLAIARPNHVQDHVDLGLFLVVRAGLILFSHPIGGRGLVLRTVFPDVAFLVTLVADWSLA